MAVEKFGCFEKVIWCPPSNVVFPGFHDPVLSGENAIAWYSEAEGKQLGFKPGAFAAYADQVAKAYIRQLDRDVIQGHLYEMIRKPELREIWWDYDARDQIIVELELNKTKMMTLLQEHREEFDRFLTAMKPEWRGYHNEIWADIRGGYRADELFYDLAVEWVLERTGYFDAENERSEAMETLEQSIMDIIPDYLKPFV